MNSLVSPEIEARVSVQPDILSVLRNAHRQLEELAGMVQSDEGCQEVLGKLCEVHDALSSVVDQLVADHLEYCFAASFQTLSPARRRQALIEIVSLYALVSRQAPQLIGKEVSWQHK